MRHRVLARADYQCEYRGSGGHRCPQRTGLEIDHRRPFARGGGHDEENLRALCKAHNLFRAEKVFGRGRIRAKAAARRCGGGSAKGVIGRGAGTCTLDDPPLA
jgi:5-methylcytosine-specific restriction endonuclease McrA